MYMYEYISMCNYLYDFLRERNFTARIHYVNVPGTCTFTCEPIADQCTSAVCTLPLCFPVWFTCLVLYMDVYSQQFWMSTRRTGQSP